MSRVSQPGFALPTVLIASIVMMIVLVGALVATTSTRTLLDEQFYGQLAREAAESGAVFAAHCMNENEYNVTWAGGVLTTGSSCNRGSSTASNYVLENDRYRTLYEVANMPNNPDQNIITVTGKVEMLRESNQTVYKTFTHQLQARVSSELSARKVAFGYACCSEPRGAHFGAVTADGRLFTTGSNGQGQVGHGTTNDSLVPAEFILPADVTVSDIKTSFLSVGRSTFAITSDGEVYAAGLNNYGQLGVNSTANQVRTPQKMVFSPALTSNEKVTNVVNNVWATYAITSSGRLFSSGSCESGVGGRGTVANPSCTESRVMRPVELRVGSITYQASDIITTDNFTTFIVSTSGRLFGWGLNLTGALGTIVPVDSSTAVPTRLHTFGDTTSTRVKHISTDGRTIYVITQNGLLYAQGDNADLQIDGTTVSPRTSFVQVPAPTGCPSRTANSVVDVRTDRSHAIVLYSNGNVCTMGFNNVGQLGRNSSADRLSIGPVTGLPSNFQARSVAVSSVYLQSGSQFSNSMLVGQNGTVYGAGSNAYYQLGLGGTSTTNRPSFTRMSVFGPNNQARDVEVGGGTAIVTTLNGRVYSVGNNTYGQLGDGTTTNSSTPRANKYINISRPSYY